MTISKRRIERKKQHHDLIVIKERKRKLKQVIQIKEIHEQITPPIVLIKYTIDKRTRKEFGTWTNS